MKNKNSKLIKNLVVCASGLTLLNFCIYKGYSELTKTKPFKDNKYKATKVYETELTSQGKIKKEYYSSYKIEEEGKEAIVFKTPFLENTNGEYEKNHYLIPTNLYSNEEVNMVKENISNQELLFEQDFIVESMINIEDAPNLNIYKVEKSNDVPDYNSYEISYLSREQNTEDYIYVPNKRQDVINNIVFSLTLLVSDSIYTAAYVSSKNKQKKKIK